MRNNLLHPLTILFVSIILSIPTNVQSQSDPLCSINDNVLKIDYGNNEYTGLIEYGARKVSCNLQKVDDLKFIFVRYEATMVGTRYTTIVTWLNIYTILKEGDKNFIKLSFKDTVKDWLEGDKEPDEDKSIVQLKKVDDGILLILKSTFNPDDKNLWLRFLYDPIKKRFLVQ